MLVTIIDARDARRERLAEELALAGVNHVQSLHDGTHWPPGAAHPDLLLLHVGSYQEDEGDSIATLLEQFRQHSWILCYYGGDVVEAAAGCDAAQVAVFPSAVEAEDPGQDLVRTVQKVLSLLPERSSLPEDCFRSAVTGFDVLLEAKLDVLTSALTGEAPLPDHLTELGKIYPGAYDDKGQLLVPPGNRLEGVAHLRKMFFHEASLTDVAECI